MGKWMGLILLLVWVSASHAVWRVEADRDAKKAFEELHFFYNGRGMMLSPGLISAYNLFVPGLGVIDEKTFKQRWGVVFNDENRISGLHDVEHKGHRIGVVGCVFCHSGRAAGRFIVGLGNKNVDVYQLGKDIHTMERYWKYFIPGIAKDRAYRDMEKAAMYFSRYLANPNIGNLTQGLVPISFIRGWFYRIHKVDVPQDMNRGQVKVPHLWGYGEKRKVGQFCDGYGDGTELGWAVAVELAAGQTPDGVRTYYDKAKHAEESFDHFLPPPYPFEIDQELVATGKNIFNNTCSNCHGTYERDSDGFPVYQAPNWYSWQVVQTDRDRVAGHSRDFNQLVATNPLVDIMRYKNFQQGYFAPRLEGIWARFPYLHNGSVPTLDDLLKPAAERPRYFSLRRAGERERFDSHRVGLTLPKTKREWNDLKQAVSHSARDVYNGDLVGHSNVGHEFFTDFDEPGRQALLEYLKSL